MNSVNNGVQRIIGIDPGSRYTGYGIVDKMGNRLKYVHSGVINSSKLKDIPEKLEAIFKNLTTILETYQPTAGSIERIFHSVNAHSSLVLGHARGVAILALKMKEIAIYEYAPNEIKSATVGVGRAAKSQVASMVQVLLNHREKMAEDESDALAAAICHANNFDLRKLQQQYSLTN